MVLQLVKDMIYSFVKLAKNTFIFAVILCAGLFPLTSVYAQTSQLYVTDIGAEQRYGLISCDEMQPLRIRVNSHPDMNNVNEVRLPFTKFNAGANAGSFSNLEIYEGATLLETVPTIPINWIYHNNIVELTETDSNNWSKIALTGEYNIASTSQIEIRFTCTGSSVYRNLWVNNSFNGVDTITKSTNFAVNGAPIIAFAYTQPIPPNTPLNLDLLGSTTPLDVFNAVSTGVTTTSDTFSPLYAILGVPLSFVLGRGVIGLIKTAV